MKTFSSPHRLFGQSWTITTFWQFNIIFSSKTIICKSQCKITTFSSASMCSFQILFQITLISFIFEAYSSSWKSFCMATIKNCVGLWILYYFLVNKLACHKFMSANRRQEKTWVREKSILFMTQGQHDSHIHFSSPCLLGPMVAK